MSGHTPGPWKWDGEPGRSDLRHEGEPGDSDGCVLRHESYEGIWFSAYGQPGVDEANARLIAAAPDLLGALEELEALGGLGRTAHTIIRNAIAKATGATP